MHVRCVESRIMDFHVIHPLIMYFPATNILPLTFLTTQKSRAARKTVTMKMITKEFTNKENKHRKQLQLLWKERGRKISMNLHNFPPLPSDFAEGNQKIKMGSPLDNQGLDEALESNTSNISLLVRWNWFSLATMWTQSCLRFFI